MAQYAEGQRLRGSDGNFYVVRNGVPVRESPTPLVQNPKAPFEAPQAQADLTGKNIGNAKTAFELEQERRQAAADTRIKNAQAIQEEEKAANAAFQNGDALGDPKLTGTARLASVPDSQRPLVQLLLNNQLSQLGAFSLKSPQMQSLLSTAKAIDPNFDPSLFGARYKAITDFTGEGKGAVAVGAINRLAANLQALKAISDRMGGPNLGFSPLNSVVATTNEAFEPKLRAAYDALLPEIANQFDLIMKSNKGTPTVSGIGEVMNGLKRQQSQAERDAAIQQVVKAVHGAILPLRQQWDSAYGGNTPPPMWVSEDAAKFFASIDPADAKTYQYETHPLPGLHGDANPMSGGGQGGSGPGYSPPPTGATNLPPTPSTDGYNLTPDPQTTDFWDSAVRQGTSYRDALRQWQSDVKVRGLVGIVPPPAGAYHKAADYIRDHPNIPYQPFSGFLRTPTTQTQRVATDVAFSGPGVGAGHFANSLAANLPTAIAGDQGARYNAVSTAAHPNWAMGGDIAGTVGGALATGAAAKGVAPALGRFGNLIAGNSARAGLTGDALFGGTSGAAQNPDNPLGGAIIGTGSMLTGNLAGRAVIGPALRVALDNPLVQRGISGARGMFGGEAFAPPAALDSGQNLIFNRAGDIGDIQTNLQDAANFGLPYALADANPKLRALAGSAVRKSANVRQLAENTLGPRQMGQAERAIAQIDSNLAPVGDVPTMKADAVARARAASKPLYDKAFAQPTPNDPQIMEMLSTPAGETAVRNAYEIALNSGESPGELSITIGPDGKPAFNGLPNWKTLQYVKMGMDKVVTDNANPVTGKIDLSNPANRALNDLRARFVGRLGELNPDYQAANDAYSSIIGQGTAAERGAAVTSIGVTPEQAQIAVTNAGHNLPHFQRGYASAMADQAERSRLTTNPYNMIYGSLGQRAKIGTVFPEGASNFARVNGLEGDMARTNYETLGGSPTATRFEADKAFDGPNLGDAAFDLGVSAATGVPPVGLIQRGLRGFASSAKDRLNLGRGARAKADAIGPLLLNTDPNANLILLNSLFAQGAARRAYLQSLGAASGQIGAGMFGAPILYGAGQQ